MLEPRYGIERGWPIAPGQQVRDVQPVGFLPSTDPDIIGVPAGAVLVSYTSQTGYVRNQSGGFVTRSYT